MEGIDQAGFTLIELLIVILVMGILTAVIVLALGGIADRKTTASCPADGKSRIRRPCMRDQRHDRPVRRPASIEKRRTPVRELPLNSNEKRTD